MALRSHGMRRTAAAVILIGGFFCAAVPWAQANDVVEAVTIQGRAEFTICRSWLVYTSCTTHKVQLPNRIAVGDLVPLSYESNTKSYAFRIGLIRREGEGCILLSDRSGADEKGDRIMVGRCAILAETPPKAR
jgi:hypothetical protein